MMDPVARPHGVQQPQGQLSTGQGAPRTVTNFVEARTFAVEYVDDAGNKHVTLAMRIGGRWHLPPNGENYAATLRPLANDSWLAKAFESRLGDAVPATVPAEDVVDVIAGS